MALIACPECKKQISDTIESCPHCGYKLTKEKIEEIKKDVKGQRSGKIIIFIVIVLVFAGLVYICTPENKSPVPLTKEEQKIQDKFGVKPHQYSSSGAVDIVTIYLSNIAKDPDSLKIEDWSDISYNEKDGWLVRATYRAKNSFGGYVKETNWFVMRHGKVVAMKPYNAYK